MPELDGYAATGEIRRHEDPKRHTSIIALTAHATSEDRARCLDAGMDDYITKPFSSAALEAALQRAVDKAPAPPRKRVGPAHSRRLEPVLDASRLALVAQTDACRR